jgi:hypothetical protein
VPEDAKDVSKLHPCLTFGILQIGTFRLERLGKDTPQLCVVIHTLSVRVADREALLDEGTNVVCACSTRRIGRIEESACRRDFLKGLMKGAVSLPIVGGMHLQFAKDGKEVCPLWRAGVKGSGGTPPEP